VRIPPRNLRFWRLRAPREIPTERRLVPNKFAARQGARPILFLIRSRALERLSRDIAFEKSVRFVIARWRNPISVNRKGTFVSVSVIKIEAERSQAFSRARRRESSRA